jgi:4-hydroxy-3-polyprenylbenzoate decarboxylase
MQTNDLHKFITLLESHGELSRITVSVDPLMEVAAITNRVCKQPEGGAALLFEQPSGSNFQVATNLFGSLKRVCLALGVTGLADLNRRMSTLLERIPDPDIMSLDQQITALPEFCKFAPNHVALPDPALVPMNNPALTVFPFIQSWSDDGAAEGWPRYMTLPQIFTAAPDGSAPNCGVYRVQLRGEREVAIQWKAGSGGAGHAGLYQRAGRAMPVAIVLGGDPATLFSAMFPLPGNLDEMSFAGFLRGMPLDMVPCRSVPLMVPLGAEVVIEGYVDPGQTVMEGPFGNHSGFYAPAAPAALMRVTAISHRVDAVIAATVVGPPPMEDCWMSLAWERLLLAFLSRLIPSIKDIHLPFEWVFHQSAMIYLENPQPGMVRNISAILWSLPWFRSARVLVFVAANTEIKALSRVAWKVINVTNFTDDIIYDRVTDRVAIDATGCRSPRKEVKMSSDCADLITRRWKEYGLA